MSNLIHISLAGVGFYYDALKDVIFNDMAGKIEAKKYCFTEDELTEIRAAAARFKIKENVTKITGLEPSA